MRRLLPASILAVLILAVATPANAGYLIIRVLLEGNGSSGPDTTTSPMGYPSAGSPPMMPPGTGKSSSGDPRTRPNPFQPGTINPMGGTVNQHAPSAHDPTRSLVVVIPVDSDLKQSHPFYAKTGIGAGNPMTNPRWKQLRLTHRGLPIVTNLFTDESTIQWYENLMGTPADRRTREMDIRARFALWENAKTNSKLLYEVIVSALEVGMVEQAVDYSDKLLAAVGEKQDGLAPEVARFVKTYKVMQSRIKDPPQKRGNADWWRTKLTAREVYPLGHYALVYWDTPSDELQRRAALLEENFRGFYLWHATRGIELPVPETPLVVVLPRKGAEVLPLALALDAPADLPADGFYAPEHDVLVLSPERLDGLGQSFIRQAQQIYSTGVPRDQLLKGKGPPVHTDGKDGAKKPDEVAWMQTMALVERFVDENSAVHAVSREGTRQLLYASGQLPRYVNLPEWLASGSINTFARPKDPAFIADEKGKWSVTVATGTGYGLPNYVLQRYLRDLADKKELNPDRAELLKNILSDAYFAGLRDPREANDPDPRKAGAPDISLTSGGGAGSPGTRPPMGMGMPPGIPGPLGPPPGGGMPPRGSSAYPPTMMPPTMGGGVPAPGTPAAEDAVAKLRKARERLAIKAEATSWALCYYLARERPKEFRKFLDELAALPRDLPPDSAVVLALFCKAFELDGSKDSLRRFADVWLEHVNALPRVGYDIPLVEPKPATTGSGPMGMMGGTPPGPRPDN
jgi:hypothetical protein